MPKSLLRVTYEAEPAITGFDQAKAAGLPPGGVWRGSAQEREPRCRGGAGGLASPDRRDVPDAARHNHNAIEPHAVTVVWQGDQLHVHDASQCVTHVAWSLAQAFGMEEKQVHVTLAVRGRRVWRQDLVASTTSWRWRLRSSPAGPCASRSRGRASTAWSAGAPSPSSGVAIGAQADGCFDAIIHTGVVSP